MSLRVSFELDESDLQHFRLIMREARKAAAAYSAAEIVARANDLLTQIRDGKMPQFVAERLERLSLMIRMLEDHEWRLPAADSARVLNALAYFCDSEDLIPDHVPGLGFLDDAIMIELVARELRHELDAYRDFCEFRERAGPRRTLKPRSTDIGREEWLAERRSELLARMRRRRETSRQRGDGPRLL